MSALYLKKDCCKSFLNLFLDLFIKLYKLLCLQAALIQHIGNLRHIGAVVHVEQNIQAAVP